MKSKILLAALLLAASAAFAATHMWTKISEEEGINGKTVCEWECLGFGHGGEHYTTTAGYSVCPYPY